MCIYTERGRVTDREIRVSIWSYHDIISHQTKPVHHRVIISSFHVHRHIIVSAYHMYLYIYVCMYICMNVCMYVCMYVCINMCMCIYTYIYIRTRYMYIFNVDCICLWVQLDACSHRPSPLPSAKAGRQCAHITQFCSQCLVASWIRSRFTSLAWSQSKALHVGMLICGYAGMSVTILFDLVLSVCVYIYI